MNANLEKELYLIYLPLELNACGGRFTRAGKR
jgi:hypothetical protein